MSLLLLPFPSFFPPSSVPSYSYAALVFVSFFLSYLAAAAAQPAALQTAEQRRRRPVLRGRRRRRQQEYNEGEGMGGGQGEEEGGGCHHRTGGDRSLDWRRQRKFSKSAAAHSSSPPRSSHWPALPGAVHAVRLGSRCGSERRGKRACRFGCSSLKLIKPLGHAEIRIVRTLVA